MTTPFYVWRDPARNSRQRLSRLTAHDEYVRSIGADDRTIDDLPAPQIRGAVAANYQRTLERRAEFTRHRENGLTVREASDAVFIDKRTGNRWELARLRQAEGAQ